VITRVAAAATAGLLLFAVGARPSQAASPELIGDTEFAYVHDTAGGPPTWVCREGTSSVDRDVIGSEFTQVIGARDGDQPGVVPPVAPTGSKQLAGSPTDSTPAWCEQTVPVKPGGTYTFTVHSNGGSVTIGTVRTVSGTLREANKVSSNGSALSTPITTTFTATLDTVRIFIRGRVDGASYIAANASLTGPPSQTARPAAPTGLSQDRRTSRSTVLRWRTAPGATGYHVYRDGQLVATTQGHDATGAVVTGLTPGGTPPLTVTAVNPAGDSAPSAALLVPSLPAYTTAPDAPVNIQTKVRFGRIQLDFPAPARATDGYEVFVDGQLAGWMYAPPAALDPLSAGQHTVQVRALNAVGASALSAPVTVAGQ
jgi:hypothetical protein